MAVTALTALKFYFAQYQLTTDHNKLNPESGYDEQDGTVFGDTARRAKGTIPFVTLEGGGFVSMGTGSVHDVLKANISVADVPVTLAPTGGADGQIAEFFKAMVLRYKPGGRVGTLMPFSVSAKGQGVPLVSGKILGTGSKTATANGTARQLGAVTASQRIYAALHVLSVSGTNPTLNVVIASDNAQGFPSGATQITFAQKTAAGSEFKSALGAITDDWWRAQWTIGGTATPTFDIVIAVGIAEA